MAQSLSSPGVNVSVIDQSFYTPAAPGTVPLIFVATAENKSNASATGIAQGTTKANAGTVWVITSQRDLTDTFGTPYFQTDSSNNPVNASELSEYGLQSAYSVLGASSQAYVVRADVDLGALAGSANPPSSTPADGSIWIDTSDSTFGVNEWSTTTNSFTVKSVNIIDDSTTATNATVSSPDYFGNITYTPNTGFGSIGSYAMVLTSANTNQLWYKTTSSWTTVTNTFDTLGKSVYLSPNYQYPPFTANTATGSVWVKTNVPGQGANWDVKQFNAATAAWKTVNAPLFGSTQSAINSLDSVGGGVNIPVGTVFVEYDYNNLTALGKASASFKLWKRNASSPTTLTVSAGTTLGSSGNIFVRQTAANGTWTSVTTLSMAASATPIGSQITTALNNSISAGNLHAVWNAGTSVLTITHALGGDFEITDDQSGAYLTAAGISATKANVYPAPAGDHLSFVGSPATVFLVSNWAPLAYTALSYAPSAAPADGKLWFDNNISAVDIMYNDGTKWVGYRNSGAFTASDPNGPLISATAPTVNSQGSALVTGDIWVDTSVPDMYGQNIYVYNSTNAVGQKWVMQDVNDNYSPNGWVFADARWSNTSTTNMEVLTPISSMLTSNFVDPDCPDPLLYPKGTRLFNTRRSGNNVKRYYSNFIPTNFSTVNPRYPSDASNESTTHYFADRWVTESGSAFGRMAQRAVVVEALKALVSTSQAIRDTDTLNYNLIATPGYTELITNMINLNSDIGQLALVVGDAPFRLPADATSLNNWGKNTALATDNGDDGLVSYDAYTAVYYPSGHTNDNKGNSIVVPPSHMMLNTIISSDNVSYPWFAPAGTRRGIVNNASSVGYVDSTTGKFKTVSLHESLRNVLAAVEVNPIATLPSAGLTVMGQYTRAAGASSLDRVNVVRLVTYLRRQLGVLAKPYLFEPNDNQTRKSIKTSIESLLSGLVSQRALYDFVVVCDQTNNTPTRIDRNELWVDVAIEPVKSVEFIYIPLRLLNTGAIASGNYGSQLSGNSTTSSGQ